MQENDGATPRAERAEEARDGQTGGGAHEQRQRGEAQHPLLRPRLTDKGRDGRSTLLSSSYPSAHCRSLLSFVKKSEMGRNRMTVLPSRSRRSVPGP